MALLLGVSAVSYGTRFLADKVCSIGVLSCDYITGGHAKIPKGYTDGNCAPYDGAYISAESNYAILVLTALFAASMAFSIGGNDGANAWATTVHSFAITLKPACILAAIFEVLGATTIGYGVSTSTQKGISNLSSPDCFACGYCNSSMDLYYIFRAPNPRQRALIFVPYLYFAVVFVIVFLIMVKGPVTKKQPRWKGVLVGLAFGVVALIAVVVFLMPRIKKGLPSASEANRIGLHLVKDADTVAKGEAGEFEVMKSPDVGEGELVNGTPEARLSMQLLAEYDSLTIEQQDAMYMFKHLLILVACLQSFSHGSNDTANATAAFAAVVEGFKNGRDDCTSPESPWWTMLLGGLFLGAGIWFIGYKVMDTIGKNISIVTFDRAFCTEFASSCTVVVCTLLNIPVSTTHCQVGAVIFISMAAKEAGMIKWKLVAVILFSWIATLPFTAGLAALIAYLLKFAMKA